MRVSDSGGSLRPAIDIDGSLERASDADGSLGLASDDAPQARWRWRLR
jgi:hypothetical protein